MIVFTIQMVTSKPTQFYPYSLSTLENTQNYPCIEKLLLFLLDSNVGN